MYLLSALHGHGTSSAPSSSGIPTVCRQGTNSSSPSASSAPCPMRVMILMLTATYVESVNCTPTWLLAEPSGPIENGTTYIVRPRIEPVNSSVNWPFISAGSRQLFVGPASASVAEQMNVLSSTRATSPGRSSGASPQRASRTCPHRPAVDTAPRTPPHCHRTSESPPAASSPRLPAPRQADARSSWVRGPWCSLGAGDSLIRGRGRRVLCDLLKPGPDRLREAENALRARV